MFNLGEKSMQQNIGENIGLKLFSDKIKKYGASLRNSVPDLEIDDIGTAIHELNEVEYSKYLNVSTLAWWFEIGYLKAFIDAKMLESGYKGVASMVYRIVATTMLEDEESEGFEKEFSDIKSYLDMYRQNIIKGYIGVNIYNNLISTINAEIPIKNVSKIKFEKKKIDALIEQYNDVADFSNRVIKDYESIKDKQLKPIKKSEIAIKKGTKMKLDEIKKEVSEHDFSSFDNSELVYFLKVGNYEK